jgi:hypothetical protein
MNYLLSQIWLCLLAATIIGLIAGWFLQSGISKRIFKQREMDWKNHFAKLDQERNYHEKQAEKLKVKLEEGEALSSEYTQKQQTLQTYVSELESELTQTRQHLENEQSRTREIQTQLEASELKLSELREVNRHQPETGGKTETRTGNITSQAKGKLGNFTSVLSQKASGLKGNVGEFAAQTKLELTTAKNEILDRVGSMSDNDKYPIESIRAISREEATTLRDMAIETTKDLLDRCYDQSDIRLLSGSTGWEPWKLKSWVSAADLMRVKGIGGRHAELLELAGIGSVQILARSSAERLASRLAVINKHVDEKRKAPDADTIRTWIDNARALPPILDSDLEKL